MLKIFIFVIQALADPGILYNQTSSPIGEKEMFQANTGIGGVESAGAVYYNPAALTQIKEAKLSISGSSFMYFKGEFSPLSYFDDTEVNYGASGFNTIPSSLVSVKTYGETKVAFSLLTPYSLQLENKSTTQTDVTPYRINIFQNLSEDDLWLGLTLAHKFQHKKLNGNTSWGLSLFGVKHSENTTINLSFYGPNANGGAAGNLPDYQSTTQRQSIDSYGLLLVAGFLQEFESFRWGLRLQAPYVQLYNSSDYTSNNYSYWDPDHPAPIEFYENSADVEGIQGEFEMPISLGGGLVFTPKDKFEISWDFSLQFPTQYHPYAKKDPNDTFVKTKTSFRTSAGVRYLRHKNEEYYAGLSFSPSAKDKETEGSIDDQYRISLGTRHFYDKFYTGIGLTYMISKGKYPFEVPGGGNREGKTHFETAGLIFTSGYNF